MPDESQPMVRNKSKILKIPGCPKMLARPAVIAYVNVLDHGTLSIYGGS